MLISKRLGSLRIGQIQSLTKIPDVVAVCSTDITLSVELIGDLKGHTLLWEQISGTTTGIVYTSPLNQTTLTYFNDPIIGNRDDKLFRFWLDKGKSYAQYRDIWVWGTPVDKVQPTVYQLSNYSNITDVSGSAVTINAYIGLYEIFYPDNTTFSGYCIEWDFPTNQDNIHFINYTVQKYDIINGVWIDVYTTTDIIYANILIDTTYRVVGKYTNDYTSQFTYAYSQNVSYTIYNPVPHSVKLYDDFNTPSYNNSNVQNVVSGYLNYTYDNYYVESELNVPVGYNNSNVQNIISGYLNYTYDTYYVESELNVPISYNNSNINNIVSSYQNFSNVNIGG